MSKRQSCAQVHELPWGHCRIGNNREGLFFFLVVDTAIEKEIVESFRQKVR